MVRKSRLIVAMLLIGLPVHAAAAYADPNDPAAGSPSGAVYELPFEKGRADAAPAGSGGTGAPGAGDTSGEGASGEDSFYRSENNFGSSSQVPGAPGGGKGAGAGQGGSGVGPGADGAAGSGGSGASGLNAAAAHVADSGNTSPAATIGLLAVISLVAGGIGLVATRANRLSSHQ